MTQRRKTIYRPWTNRDIEILAARYPIEGPSPELCSVLERSKGAVRRQALRSDTRLPERPEQTFIERVRDRVDVDGDCWIWKAPVRAGDVPRMRWGKKTVTVRRQMLRALGRRVRAGHSAVAECKTPGCVSPEHVIAVSRSQLVREYATPVPTPVRRRINRASSVTRILTDEQVSEIIASEELGRVLAERYRVSESTISAYRMGRLRRQTVGVWSQLMR